MDTKTISRAKIIFKALVNELLPVIWQVVSQDVTLVQWSVYFQPMATTPKPMSFCDLYYVLVKQIA